MTVSTTIIKNSHNGNGSTTTFAYQFKILQDSDLQVIIRSSNGTETTKSLSTHYTVTGAGGNSGTVVFTSCLLYTSPSPRDRTRSRMPSSA